jgi:hypothetical protein
MKKEWCLCFGFCSPSLLALALMFAFLIALALMFALTDSLPAVLPPLLLHPLYN